MSLPMGLTTRYLPFDAALDERLEAAESWLGALERRELATLRHAQRRRQWLAGRWLAKQLVGNALGMDDPAQFDILTRDERGRGVRPRVACRGQELRLSLSISHTELGILVALAKTAWLTVGVDLAPGQVTAGEGFFRLWFTAFERQWIDHDRPNRAAVVWAVKEAVYKAMNTGQSWTPRHIEVRPRGRGSLDCWYRGRLLEGLTIELSRLDGQLGAIVARRRNSRAWQTDATSQPRPLGISRRVVVKERQRPRFIVRGY